MMKLMQTHGVPSGVVQTGEDLMLHDEQVREGGYFVELDHPDGKALCEGMVIGMSKTPGKVRAAGPSMGQHNEYVYGEILGMSEQEMNQCYVEGVFD